MLAEFLPDLETATASRVNDVSENAPGFPSASKSAAERPPPTIAPDLPYTPLREISLGGTENRVDRVPLTAASVVAPTQTESAPTASAYQIAPALQRFDLTTINMNARPAQPNADLIIDVVEGNSP